MMFSLLLLLCLGHCLSDVIEKPLSIDTYIGATVTLPCDGSAVTDINKFQWRFSSGPLGVIKNGNWKADDRYTLLSMEQNNFSLIINPVKEEDGGTYMCRNDLDDIQSIRLNVVGVSTGGQNPHRILDVCTTPVLPSLVVTAVIVMILLAVVGAAVFIRRLWNQQRDSKLPGPEPGICPD